MEEKELNLQKNFKEGHVGRICKRYPYWPSKESWSTTRSSNMGIAAKYS
jgi:hypothetical protein